MYENYSEIADAEYTGTGTTDRLVIRVSGPLRFRLFFAKQLARLIWAIIWSDTTFSLQRKNMDA